MFSYSQTTEDISSSTTTGNTKIPAVHSTTAFPSFTLPVLITVTCSPRSQNNDRISLPKRRESRKDLSAPQAGSKEMPVHSPPSRQKVPRDLRLPLVIDFDKFVFSPSLALPISIYNGYKKNIPLCTLDSESTGSILCPSSQRIPWEVLTMPVMERDDDTVGAGGQCGSEA